MIEDILIWIEGENYEEYEINQHLIGIRELFQGHVVKVQSSVNFNQNKYNTLNKILAKHYILYYMKYWHNRNNYYYNMKLLEKKALTWKKEIEKQVKANESINS